MFERRLYDLMTSSKAQLEVQLPTTEPHSKEKDPLERAFDNWNFIENLDAMPHLTSFSREANLNVAVSSNLRTFLSELGVGQAWKFNFGKESGLFLWSGNYGSAMTEDRLLSLWEFDINKRVVIDLGNMNRVKFLDRVIKELPKAFKSRFAPPGRPASSD